MNYFIETFKPAFVIMLKLYYFYVKYSSETSNNSNQDIQHTSHDQQKKSPRIPPQPHEIRHICACDRWTAWALYRINYMYDTVITYATAFHTRASNANTIYSF